MAFREKDVAIFLDSDNCKFTCTIDQLIPRIEHGLQRIDPAYRICPHSRVYSGVTDVYQPHEHASMGRLGFTFLPAPKVVRTCDCHFRDPGEPQVNEFDRLMDVADALLIDEMLGRALTRRLPPNILLISTDKDFNEPLVQLFDSKRFNIFVAKNRYPNRPFYATPYARATWDWLKLQAGEEWFNEEPRNDMNRRRN